MKVFDTEKFERIKNARAAAGSVYQDASEAFLFEREQLWRRHSVFCQAFCDFKIFSDIDDEFTVIKKMPAEDFPAVQAASQSLLAKVPTDAQIYSHFKHLVDHLLTAKRAESRRDVAAENQQNHGRCFAALENFAKKHTTVKADNWALSESVGQSDVGFDNSSSYPMA